MAEIKALIFKTPILRRRRDTTSGPSVAVGSRSMAAGPASAVVADEPPPYTIQDPMSAIPRQAPSIGSSNSSTRNLHSHSQSLSELQNQSRRTSLPGWNRSERRAGNGGGSSSRSASPAPSTSTGMTNSTSISSSSSRNDPSRRREPASAVTARSLSTLPPPPPAPPDTSFSSAPQPPQQNPLPHISLPLHDAASPPYSPMLCRDHNRDVVDWHTAIAGTSTGSRSRSASSRVRRRASAPLPKAHISTLPLGILHYILTLTLDPSATPSSDPYLDYELEPFLRVAVLFKMRGVDRRFFLAATAILRDRLIPAYLALLPLGASSDPHPPGGDGEDPTGVSVFAQRSRETAVLDRFIAFRIGDDLRRAESSLCQDSGEQGATLLTLQPAARIEDLLLQLPPSLISPEAPPRGELFKSLPLPHPHLMVQLTPGWASLYFSHGRVDMPNPSRRAPRRVLVVDVRRRHSAEETAFKLKEALEHIRRGWREWGERVG